MIWIHSTTRYQFPAALADFPILSQFLASDNGDAIKLVEAKKNCEEDDNMMHLGDGLKSPS